MKDWEDKIDRNAFKYWQKSCCMVCRRCQLKCRGCGVIAKQCQYEMTIEEWKTALDIQKAYGVGFIVWFGGEPTLREDLPELIKYCNKINMPHTIITNSIRMLNDESYYNRIIDAKPFGISASFNGISHGKAKHGDELKSEYGYQLIQKVRKDLPKCDVVANMAVHKDNIEALTDIVQWLTDNKIWIIMTFIHLCRPYDSSFYWYRGSVTGSNVKLKLTEKDLPAIRKTRDWFKEHYDELLLHNEKSYFDRWDNEALYQSWHCSEFVNPNINPDGFVMPCIDIPLVKPISILDLPGREEEFQKAFYTSIDGCTHGCCWDHLVSCHQYLDDPDYGKKVFAHKHRKC